MTRTTLEREQKLEAPSGWELPDLRGEKIETRVFTSVYYDTPARSLARSGITLRRRAERGLSVWQLKLPTDDARLEIEEPGGPLPPESIRALLRAHLFDTVLVAAAELGTRRQAMLVTHGDGTVEVSLDQVQVMDARRVTAEFTEIEVELKAGSPRTVGAIVKKLERAGARSVELTPKLFRALPLPERPSETTPFETFRARLREQLEEVLAIDPGVRLACDATSVHKLRVATRQVRALLRAARSVYVGDVRDLSLELKWLAGVLGDVRDLDVAIAHLRTGAETFSSDDRTAALRLLRALDRDRARARRALRTALEGERYAALLSRFEEVLRTIEPSHEQPSLASLAHAELKKFDRKSPRTAAGLTDERLHDLRKRGKRVRYAYELAGKWNVVKRAKHLQDVLGDNQDGVVAEQRLRALAETAPPEQALAAGLLIAREQDRRNQARAAWRHVWKRLVAA